MLQRRLERVSSSDGEEIVGLLGLGISGEEIIDPYIDKIDSEHLRQAKRLSQYYTVIYVIENFLRSMISSLLDEESQEDGSDDPSWWKEKAPEHVKKYARETIKKETDVAVSQRATESIQYVTFGHLSDIIISNWDVFQLTFTSQKAVQRVLGLLNTIRGPIAHCNELQDDEVARLFLAVRDFFRILK